jgi:hypothetical protein
MRPAVRPVLWIALGVVIAAGLSVAAFAIANDTIGQPVTPIPVTSAPEPSLTPAPTRTPDPRPSRSDDDDDGGGGDDDHGDDDHDDD